MPHESERLSFTLPGLEGCQELNKGKAEWEDLSPIVCNQQRASTKNIGEIPNKQQRSHADSHTKGNQGMTGKAS